jgi:hypothetical protein
LDSICELQTCGLTLNFDLCVQDEPLDFMMSLHIGI